MTDDKEQSNGRETRIRNLLLIGYELAFGAVLFADDFHCKALRTKVGLE